MSKISVERGGTTNTVRMVSSLLQGHLFPYLTGLFDDLLVLNDERVNKLLKEYFGGEFQAKK